MKKLLTIFFVTLGVIFFLLLLAGTYLYVVDPLNLKPFLSESPSVPMPSLESTEATSTASATTAEAVDQNPLLNDAQEQTLDNFGVDPASLPSEITPEQEACFTEELGAERVAEITAGDSPTAREFFATRRCWE